MLTRTSELAIRMLMSSIERRVSAENALAESQQRIYQMQKLEALGLLVGGVAHDFNNLLTAILGQAGLLLDSEERDGDARESLEEIVEAASQASNLTRQLLAQCNSGDTAGNRSRVVGYAAFALY